MRKPEVRSRTVIPARSLSGLPDLEREFIVDAAARLQRGRGGVWGGGTLLLETPSLCRITTGSILIFLFENRSRCGAAIPDLRILSLQRRVSFSLVWWGNSLFQLPARKFYLHGLARFGLVSNFHLFGLLVSVNNLSVRWVELEATTRTSQGIFISSSSLHAESETDKGVNTCCAGTSGVLKKNC